MVLCFLKSTRRPELPVPVLFWKDLSEGLPLRYRPQNWHVHYQAISHPAIEKPFQIRPSAVLGKYISNQIPILLLYKRWLVPDRKYSPGIVLSFSLPQILELGIVHHSLQY